MPERCSVCEVKSLELTAVYDESEKCSWFCTWCFTNGFFWCCQECQRFNTHAITGSEWCVEEFGAAPRNFETYSLWCLPCVEKAEKERLEVLAGLDEQTRSEVLTLSQEWCGEFAELLRVVRAL